MEAIMDAKEQAALQEIAANCLCSEARKTARAVTRLYARHFAGTGLEPAQFTILVAIRLTEPVTLLHLAGHLGLERTTFTRNLGVLQRNGLVTVKRGADARKRLLSLTPAGRNKLRKALPRWHQAQQSAKTLLGEENFTKLSKALSLSAGFNNSN
jgi:DNA-binding MarR family transcriptional regulator